MCDVPSIAYYYYYYYYYTNALLYVLYHLSSLLFLFVIPLLSLRSCAVSVIGLTA